MYVAISDLMAALGLKSRGDARSPAGLALGAGFLLAAAVAPMAQTTSGVLIETWTGIPGASVANLVSHAKFPESPTTRTYGGAFEMAQDQGNEFGARVRAYITPPVTGSYTFWIASDDNAELWLGTGDNPSTATRIAYTPGWTLSRQWTKFPEQKSAAINLTGGVRYYIEALHKEDLGQDNLAVGWQGPGIGGDAERPIPASRLTPYILPVRPSAGMLRETWTGITGNLVPNLTSLAAYPLRASARDYLSLLEIPYDDNPNYGSRLRGYLTAPTTGAYTFWIAGDNDCELWLGTGENPSTASRIAHVPGWTVSREWTRFPEQKSAVINLTAGARYYVEVLHKQGLGNDYLAVGWQGPGITGETERPIPGFRLTPVGNESLIAGPMGPTGPQGPIGLTGPAGPIGPQGPMGMTGATGAQGEAGATGPEGPMGLTGATGAQGEVGATGAQGPIGMTGATGAQGEVGATGEQGPIGMTGVAGAQGEVGATGAQGPIGLTGATGAQGEVGPAGPQGPIGMTGATGAQGEIGETGPQGPIGLTGATGAQGEKGDKGDQGDVGATGATGAQGATGLTGATGPQGPIGMTGATGATGAQGEIGATGPQGPIGMTGATGAQGEVGATGPQGPIGLTGATGVQGDNGDKGDKGDQGDVGATGAQGPTGLPGATGPQGPIGLTGATGAQGAQGDKGDQGDVGATGPQGPVGLTGATGPQGPMGAMGPIGPQGPMGPNGATGAQGPTGLTGATGPQGPMGLTGATGPQGPIGNTGPQGTSGVALNEAQLAVERWFPAQQSGHTITTASTPIGMAYDGEFLWVAIPITGSVAKINKTTGATVSTTAIGAQAKAVCFDGAYIWVVAADVSTVSKVRTGDGVVLATYSTGANTIPYGIVFDGVNIWTANAGDNTVSRINAADGTLTKYPTGFNGPRSIAFDGTNLWVGHFGGARLIKMSPTGSILANFNTGTFPSGAVTSVAFDGTHIWAAMNWESGVNGTAARVRVSDNSATSFTIGAGPAMHDNISFDGHHVWFAGYNSVTKLVAASGALVGTYPAVPSASAGSGIVFDGVSIWFLSANGSRIQKF